MKKVVKRTLSLVMAAALIVGTLVMPVAAEETEIVIYENDFESYPGGTPASTAACTVTKNSGASSTAMAVATYEGFGKGLMVDEAGLNGYGNVQPVFTPTVKPTKGKVYISFDMANNIKDTTAVTDSAARSGVLMGSSQYLLGMFEDGTGSASFASPWSGFANNSWQKTIAYEPGDGIHNVQIVLDIETKYYAAYIDGVLLNSFNSSASAIDFSKITFIFNPYIIDYFDNLRISYVTNESFTATSKWGEDNSEILLNFTEGVAKADGVYALTEENLIASITRNGEDVEDVFVEDITFVTPRIAKVKLNKEVKKDTVVTLTVPETVTNVAGNAFAGTEMTLTAPVSESEAVIYENDFEAYQGGVVGATTEDGAVFSTIIKVEGTEMKAVSKDTLGTGLDIVSEDGVGRVELKLDLPSDLTTGKVYISFDMANNSMGSTIDNRSHSGVYCGTNSYLLFMREGVDKNNASVSNASFETPWQGFANNSTNKYLAYTPGDSIHNVQFVLDIANKGNAVYIDGALLHSFTGNYALTLDPLTFILNSEIIDYFDNLRISYVTDKSFKATAKWGDTNDEIILTFSEGVTFANGGYAVTEESLELSGTTATISDLQFVTPRIAKVKLSDKVAVGEDVTLKVKNATSVTENSFAENAMVLTATEELDIMITDANGKQLSASEISAGDKVYISARLGDGTESAVLLGGVYSGGVLISSAIKTITGSSMLPIVIPEDAVDFTVKGFLWNSISELKPLAPVAQPLN